MELTLQQQPTPAPPLAVRADTAGITVGDPLVVHILARLPRGAQLLDSIPRLRDTLPDGVRLLSAAPFRRTADGYAGEMRFALFRPVATHLPSLAVLYRADGAVDTLASAPIAVTVVPVVPEDNGMLQDIKGLDAAPLGAVFLAAGGACLIGFVLLLRAFLRRRRARAHVPPVVVVPPSPYQHAIAALDAVAGAPTAAEAAQLYARVADIVRQYIAAALALPALERTTPEILRSLPLAHLRNGTRDALHALLTDADLVKFARERPAPDAAGAFVLRARSIVDALRDAIPPAA